MLEFKRKAFLLRWRLWLHVMTPQVSPDGVNRGFTIPDIPILLELLVDLLASDPGKLLPVCVDLFANLIRQGSGFSCIRARLGDQCIQSARMIVQVPALDGRRCKGPAPSIRIRIRFLGGHAIISLLAHLISNHAVIDRSNDAVLKQGNLFCSFEVHRKTPPSRYC